MQMSEQSEESPEVATLELLELSGMAMVSDVIGPAAVLDLARTLGTVVPHRDSGPDGVTIIEDHDLATPGLAGFTNAGLLPHTDRSGTARPPRILVAVCDSAPRHGGDALLVDGWAVYDELTDVSPEAARALSTPRTVLFGGSDGHLGSVFTPTADGGLHVRCRFDSLARFSPMVLPYLPVLRALVDRQTQAFPLGVGCGYVLDNHRWLHGRSAYRVDRRLYRVLVAPHRNRAGGRLRSQGGSRTRRGHPS